MQKGMNHFDRIAFLDMAIYENTAWFCNLAYNALFQMDLITGRIELLNFFPGDSFTAQELYSPIAYWDNKLYIAPINAGCLQIYELREGAFTSIELDLEQYGDEFNGYLFRNAAVIQGNLYFFPGKFHAIVELEPCSLKVSYIDNWYQDLCDGFLEEEKNRIIFSNVHTDAAGNCILPCWRSQEILKINVCSGKYEILRKKLQSDAALADAIEIGDDVLASHKNGKEIFSFFGEASIVIDDNAITDKYADTKAPFFIRYGEWLYIIPALSGEAILRYHLVTGATECVYLFPMERSEKSRWIPYKGNILMQKRISEDRLAVYSVRDGKLLLIKMGTAEVWAIEPKLEDRDVEKVRKHFCHFLSDEPRMESGEFRLDEFLTLIAAGE